MPDSQHKYLYERLGDHDFQQLASALLTDNFPGYVPMALRQADGGRDGLRKDEAGKTLVYQVKWSARGTEKNAVSWLEQVVKAEADNLRRLASEGVRRYVLVTNIPSTAKQQSGTFDELQRKLDQHAKNFGYEEMACIWREQLNAFVDNAPQETKWAYAEMLAGWDLVRYLITEQADTARHNELGDLVRKVAAAQWAEDRRVKFSQSEVDKEHVVDLFVDVHVEQVTTFGPATRVPSRPMARAGAAACLLDPMVAPYVLVRGAPGQGKSTLSQYICQAHRASFLPQETSAGDLPKVSQPLFPVRLDLSDYALWLDGNDVWDHASPRKRARVQPRRGHLATVEHFLADLLTYESGKDSITANTVQDLFSRLPSIVVFDGLDEVGSTAARGRVVQQIEKFVARTKAACPQPPRVVVTTRPSAGALPEPSPELFDVLALKPFTAAQRETYLRKWCKVRDITGRAARALQDSFTEKSREPYIAELAGNPMQLTILLDLLNRQGAATPAQRTELYDSYVDLLLAREANKHPKVVKDHQDELREIIPFLGWYLHAHTEGAQIDGRMSVADLKAAMRHFQQVNGNRDSVVDKLFVGMSDRLWALTSKIEGTYEFEVLSLREYFAARFLYDNAGEGDPEFDVTEVVRELLRRPYWLNTARFYGGNFRGRDIFALTAAIEDELSQEPTAASFIAAWTVLADGVFQRRPREARRVLTALCSDDGLTVLLGSYERTDIRALPQVPEPAGEGPDPTWTRLTGLIAANPSDPANISRVKALRELLGQRNQFNDWWYHNLCSAVGAPEQNAWLTLGAYCEAGAGTTVSFDSLDLSDGAAEAFLSAGLLPKPGSALESALLDAVLDGQCPSVSSLRSMPAQVAAALSPEHFFALGTTSQEKPLESAGQRGRGRAITQLGRARSPFAQIAKTRAFKAGEKDSTFPWEKTATALHEHAGHCFLASLIAIIGAASPLGLGYTKRPGATAFGPSRHPSALLADTREHASDAAWWRTQLDKCQDDLEHAEWALALWSIASGDVITELLADLELVINALSPDRARVVELMASRISIAGWTNNRPRAGTTGIEWLNTLIRLRTGDKPPGNSDALAARTTRTDPPPQRPLLEVSRRQGWLRIDAVSVYR